MKVKVIRRFRNKYSKNIHEVGEVLDISEKRFREVNQTSLGVFVEEIKDEPKK